MLVGILGGGQLGRMLALAGYPLGLRFRFLDPSPAAPARQVADLIVARHDDGEAIARFTEGLDVATWEFEDLPEQGIASVAARVTMHPPPAALASAQDRWTQRELCASLGLPMPACRPVSSRQQLAEAIADVGLPAILKTRRSGYDGKGQAILRSQADLDAAWQALGGQPLILEALVPFTRELSLVAVRDARGATAFYPLTENRHEQGILRLSIAPAPEAGALQAAAEDIATRLLDHLRYVGVMTVELFETDGRLLVNEVAMRVHNSGHWTIEGAPASQFENHLRAICGWPLGLTHALGHSAMLNLIGDVPPRPRLLSIPGAHVHLYGKDGRPNRKVGHVTVTADTARELEQRLRDLESLVGPAS